MMRQGQRQALRTIKARVRINAFSYTQYAFESMVDEFIYEEDVKRAIATGRLVETRESGPLGTCYVLQGFGMNEEELVLVCRILKQKIEVIDLSRA